MWTCKHCGQQVDSQLHECWNCGTGINWSPPIEGQAPFEVTETQEPASKEPPYPVDVTSYLRILGIAIGLIGVIAGVFVLTSSPDAPSELSRDVLGQIQRTNRVIYLVLGWFQIVAGITTGLVMYVIAGIAEAVLDLWQAQQIKQ